MLNKIKKLLGIKPLPLICKSDHGDLEDHCYHFVGRTKVAKYPCIEKRTEVRVFRCCRCSDEYAEEPKQERWVLFP